MRYRLAIPQFSVKQLLVGVALVSVLLAGVPTFGLFAFAVPLYVWGVSLVERGKREYRPRTTYMGIGVAALAVLLLLTGLALWVFMIRGPILSSQFYPQVMANMHAQTGHSMTSKVYCRTDFNTEVYVGRFYVAPADEQAFLASMPANRAGWTPADFHSSFPLMLRPSRPGKYIWRDDYGDSISCTTFDPKSGYVHVLFTCPRVERRRAP